MWADVGGGFQFPQGLRWHSAAAVALQEALEAYLVHLFEDAQLVAIHAKRITVMVPNTQTTHHVRGETA